MKNLLLSSALLLTSVGGFAQLSVKPINASTDSYIYVKNEILYVKGDVTLAKNRPGDTEASIYLREGGQLIQGATATSTNAGNGFLSVQQTAPVSNAYAYNYWCSPVGNAAIGPSPGNTNFGLAAIYEDKNDLKGIGTKAIQSANISGKEGFNDPLTISRRWMTVMMSPATEKYGAYTRINADNGAPAGFGFTMKGVNDGTESTHPNYTSTPWGLPQTYEFRGRPNNGEFKIPVLGPSTIPNPGGGPAVESAKMTLTGNPYPSALDLNKLFWDTNNGRLNAFYFYDEDRKEMSHLYTGKPYGYGVWVPGPQDTDPNGNPAFQGYYTAAAFFIWNTNGGHAGNTTGPGLGTNAKRFAPIGQGFMFVGSGSATVPADITIRNTQRVYKQEGTNSEFFRPDGGDNELTLASGDNEGNRVDPNAGLAVDTRTPQLRLNVVFDDQLSRELLLVFHPQATDGYDRGFDALSPMGMKSEAYFPIGPDSDIRPYVIQGTNYEPRKMIPITFTLHKTSKIEVRAIEEIRKPYEMAYLFDRQENTYRPLSSLQSAAGAFTLPAGSYEDRFFIVFRHRDSPRPDGEQDRMDTEALVKGNVGMFQNNPARQLEISNPDGYTLKAAYVYDMSGKLVISENKLGDSNRYTFYTGNLSDGVYLVKLITSDDITIDYKAMVMNK